MTVVQVITSLERGGAQRLALEAAARLHRDERPQILITGPPAALEEEARGRLGSRLIHVDDLANPIRPLRDVAALVELHGEIAALRRQGPVVVHTHSSKAGVLGRLAGRAVPGVRVVHTVHGFGFEALGVRARPWLLAAERVATSATDVLLFVSDSDRRRAEALSLSKRPERRVVPAGCDLARFSSIDATPSARAAARRSFGVADDARLAVTVANLKPQKDPLLHVRILAAWRARDPRGELLLLGDGPLRSAVLEEAVRLGVELALHLPGFVGDPRPALAAADVALLASAWEGLPIAVLEALAAGLPCVVRDVGWARDLAFAGPRLVALDEDAPPARFAEALAEMASLDRERLRLPPRFTLDGYLAALDRLYDEILAPA